MGKDTLKVGIIGSRKYENRRKIKEFIFKLKLDILVKLCKNEIIIKVDDKATGKPIVIPTFRGEIICQSIILNQLKVDLG